MSFVYFAVILVAVIYILVYLLRLLTQRVVKKVQDYNERITTDKNYSRYLDKKDRIIDSQVQSELEARDDIARLNRKINRKIVGVIKPVGPWTSMIMRMRFNLLYNLKQELEKDGGEGKNFWQLMVSASTSKIKSFSGGRSRGGRG